MNVHMEKDKANVLESLLRYILPTFSKRITKRPSQPSKHSVLEELLIIKSPRLSSTDLQALDTAVAELMKNSAHDIKRKKTTEPMDKLFAKQDILSETDAAEINYSIRLERKKPHSESYRVAILYEETEIEQTLSVKITIDEAAPKNPHLTETAEKPKEYSFTLRQEKAERNTQYYSVALVYESNYQKERLSITYNAEKKAYARIRDQSLHDFSDRVPGKHMHIEPETNMGGVLGYTYLGENFMVRRADLTGNIAKMVDIHECIHTTDEYETRILTDWIMSRERPKYIK